ncbi:hypothetical protein HMPREF9442_03087 [Paraprevotella xylaniphila YIT 11841]|uniref:Uncharacterized protein n=1 Tax=Paraprevotella xylaniphila YIT 11841 TaxID=762982 RepID=F3QXZ7_9BACT|nr:hypothetical protein HMPREF9442_03087 [Paraprevotella xylaniphila YIT 11841]
MGKTHFSCLRVNPISAFEKNILFLSPFYLHIKILCVSLYKRRKDERH